LLDLICQTFNRIFANGLNSTVSDSPSLSTSFNFIIYIPGLIRVISASMNIL
jgi:hypothetical protein